jgi:hypothetical protein
MPEQNIPIHPNDLDFEGFVNANESDFISLQMFPSAWENVINWLKNPGVKGPGVKSINQHGPWTWDRTSNKSWISYESVNYNATWKWNNPVGLAVAIEDYLKTFINNGNPTPKNPVTPPSKIDTTPETKPVKETSEETAIAEETKSAESTNNPKTPQVTQPSTLPRNLILQGPPGTGKTHTARQLANWLISGDGKRKSIADAIKKLEPPKTEKDALPKTDETALSESSQFRMVQFHPATSYEDFVRGIRVKTKEGQVTYEVEHGHLSQMCEDAAKDPAKNYVLVIDEINRANLPAVLGECIFALEYRGKPVDTAYEINDSKKLIIPENLWIIGTMNTADRSVGHLDYAIRRRFLFVDCLEDKSKVTNRDAKSKMEEINGIIATYKAEEFEAKDIQIGHTYFMGDDWKTKFEYQVKPILEEYLRDGVLGQDAKSKIEGLKAE